MYEDPAKDKMSIPSLPPIPMRTLFWFVLSGAIVMVAGIGAIAWYGRNTARSQSEFVTEFAAAQNATVYCGNGSGRDIFGIQPTPWWEWTLLSNGTVDDFSAELVSELDSRGFEVTAGPGDPSEYLLESESVETETAHLQSMGYATEWTTIRGATPQDLIIEGRVATATTPHNNCFPDSDVIIPAEPSDFDVVAVLKFRDKAFSDK